MIMKSIILAVSKNGNFVILSVIVDNRKRNNFVFKGNEEV